MANFSHLQAVMGSMRKDEPNVRQKAPIPSLENEPYYVGTTNQSIIEQSMSNAPGGDYVVRKSEKAANVFVLMLKLTQVTGMQKRIIFSQGKFIMEVGGQKRSNPSLNELLTLEPLAKNPARDKVYQLKQRAPRRQSPAQSTKRLLETAMTAAEENRITDALSLVAQAKQLGASEKNLHAASMYIHSFTPDLAAPVMSNGGIPDTRFTNSSSIHPSSISSPTPVATTKLSGSISVATKMTGFRSPSPTGSINPLSPISPINPITSSSVRVLATLRADDVTAELGLSGNVWVEITSDRKLTILPEGNTEVNKLHKWPLQLLRRYGQQANSFYFEAGTRCASGQALIYMDMDAASVRSVFMAADAALEEFRQQASEVKQKELAAIALYQQQTKLDAMEKERVQSAAMEKYKKQAEEIARRQLKENKANEAEELVQRMKAEAEELERKELEKEKHYAERAEIVKRQDKAEQQRAKLASHLTLSKRMEKAVAPRASVSAITPFQNTVEEWGAGKSKIWKALNPQPLYFQTAQDKREAEEKQHLGVVGGDRNFRAMLDVLEETHHETPQDAISPIKQVGGHREIDDEFEEYERVGDEETEEEEDPDENNLAEFDTDFAKMLNKNRQQRAIEEEERKKQLAKEFRDAKAAKQIELDKELAIIEARKVLEHKQKQLEVDKAVSAAQHRLETELVFDFTFG